MINYYRFNYSDLINHYSEFIKYVIAKSDRFSVITLLQEIGKNEGIKCEHDEKMHILEPYLERQIVGIKEWGVTFIEHESAVMNVYNCDKGVESVISTMRNFLRSEIHDMPEDICFYKGNTTWISTVTHEKWAFLHFPTIDELNYFKRMGIRCYWAPPVEPYVLPEI